MYHKTNWWQITFQNSKENDWTGLLPATHNVQSTLCLVQDSEGNSSIKELWEAGMRFSLNGYKDAQMFTRIGVKVKRN